MKSSATALQDKSRGTSPGRLGLGASLSVVTMLLLPFRATSADTAYTATGWITDVPVLPILCTNAASQVLLRGNAHTVAVQSTDPRLTGSRLVYANATYLPDGTAQVWGTAYQQVGTFDPETNFTATAGLWEIIYSGKMETNFSLSLKLAGYGSGGAIDGQRMEETMTRGQASGPIDLTVPYIYAGNIKPASVNTFEVVDNFDDNLFTGSIWGRGTCFETNQQLNVVGNGFTIPTDSIYDSYLFAGYRRAWAVVDGWTREWRVDLLHLDENGTNTAILAVGTESGPGYAFHLSRNFAFLAKWSQPELNILFCDQKLLPTTNVIMALAVTRIGQNLAITARVLDKANPDSVLYEHSPYIDTPQSDPTLDGNQFRTLTGINLVDLVADPVEAPPSFFWALLGVFKNTDGNPPFPVNVFDNLELLTYEVPRISIFPAVQLTWPAPVGAYSVEWGATPAGPWQPLQEMAVPGRQQATAPANAASRFFRLRQAP